MVDTVRQELIIFWTHSELTVDWVISLYKSADVEIHSEFATFVEVISKIYGQCLDGLHFLSSSDHTISKFQQSFIRILIKQFPTTTLAPALKSFLLSSFSHNTIVDTSAPPLFIGTIRVLQTIGLGWTTERELSVVVAEKVREFINIEAKGDWSQRYTTLLLEWVDNGLSDLLRFILGRKDGESVGQESLKIIALRALTDLRIDELFDIIKEFPESTPAIEDLKVH